MWYLHTELRSNFNLILNFNTIHLAVYFKGISHDLTLLTIEILKYNVILYKFALFTQLSCSRLRMNGEPVPCNWHDSKLGRAHTCSNVSHLSPSFLISQRKLSASKGCNSLIVVK
jgi:hypothetical protein